MSNDNNCIICNESLEQGGETVIVTSGLKTLLQASHDRKDNLHQKFAGKTVLSLHVHCRKSYTNKNSIKASQIRSTHEVNLPTTSSRALRSTTTPFNFENLCFFCGKTATQDSKQPLKIRQNVRLVQDPSLKASIFSYAASRQDDVGEEVISRISGVIDIVAAKGRYHSDCYSRFRSVKDKSSSGRPKGANIQTWVDEISQFLESSDKCLHALPTLRNQFPLDSEINDRYAYEILRIALKEKFGHGIIFPKSKGVPLLCLIDCMETNFPTTWYIEREADEWQEKLREVKAAGKIILEDILRFSYENSLYPAADTIENGGKDLIPDLLLELLLSIFEKKRDKNGDIEVSLMRKIITICHSIISICRPRSFISPVHSALGLYVSRSFGSKHLIEILHSLGMCSSYHDIEIYQASLVNEGCPKENPEAFQQYIFDNSDYNIRTLSGKDTLHVLGGIKCITPKSAVTSSPMVPKAKKVNIEGSFQIPVIQYTHSQNYVGLRNITVQKLINEENSNFREDIQPHNLLYFSGLTDDKLYVGWHGFMNSIFREKHEFETSYVLALPFINVDPSNMTAIYSALCFASKESQKWGKLCIVTFDQPLFYKACIIIANKWNELSNVIARLGGFHLLMSFLGCLGKFMEGSGIEELLCTVYGSATVPHILDGKAYARALRAHMLIQAALLLVLIDADPHLKSELQLLTNQTQEFLVQKIGSLEDILSSQGIEKVSSLLNKRCKELAAKNRTARLWLQEFKLVDLVFKYILAERTGNWDLHLEAVREMLPYFHAAGHFNFAKSAHLYLQQMHDLKNKLPPEEFKKFSENGYFTLRRTENFFSGTWSDQMIEQTLNRSMKMIGGLTHGRGLSEKTIANFIFCGPRFFHVKEAFLKFTGTHIEHGEQHVELRNSRKMIDVRDLKKFKEWFDAHPPFGQEEGSLTCLATGVVANDDVNCDNALTIGLEMMKYFQGTKFEEKALRRRDIVKTMAYVKQKVSLPARDRTMAAEQLFNRIISLGRGGDLKKLFKNEMTPYPTSLFENAVMMRKGNKSDFVSILASGLISIQELPQDTLYVIDGGYLLHAVLWPKPSTFREIIATYVSYVMRNYGNKCYVVFDGYPNESTTKSIEHLRRSRRTSASINFTLDMRCVKGQTEFLNNISNKKKLISLLSAELHQHGIHSLIAEADADREIIMQAVCVQSNMQRPVTVIGSDTDLLVLLVGLTHKNPCKLFFQKPGTSRTQCHVYDIMLIIQNLQDFCSLIFFAYAITGCDTTSALYGKGKNAAHKLLSNHSHMNQTISVFMVKTSTKEEIKNAGEQFLIDLYGGSSIKTIQTLDDLRYTIYIRKLSKMTIKSRFDIASLPPTSSAAEQHSYRVFHQIQSWLGNQLLPQEWGWCLNGEQMLVPIHSTRPAIPDDLLKIISCSCKSKCNNRCSCVKNNVKCSELCASCNEESCSNSDRANVTEFEENDDDIFFS